MIKLERMTTEYIDFEDRIRLSCAVADAPPIVVWLTQRLLQQRLLPPLLQWLERQGQPSSDVQRSDLPRPEAARAELPRADVLQKIASRAAVEQGAGDASDETETHKWSRAVGHPYSGGV